MSSHNIYESSPIQTYGNVLDMVVEYGFGGDSQGWRLRALTAVLMLCWLAFPPGCDAVLDVDTTVNAPKDIAIPATGDYDREELQKLTEFRQRHRKTVDGMLCAAAFVRNGNKFTDCTTTEAPDGSVGREWCYVEVQLVGVGFRDWDFCAGVVDYDVLRSKAKLLSQMKASELAHSVVQLSDRDGRLQKTLTHYENVCGHHTASSEAEMHEMSRALHGLERALNQVEANWRSIHLLKNEYESLEEQLVIARKNALVDKRNCAIVQGYSSPVVGDGIRASYFSNPYFRGPPVGFFDHSSLSLTFDEVLPVHGVDISAFSVRFEGYLRVPVTDTYTFLMDADCNVRMFLDGELVMEHGLESRGKFTSHFSAVGVVALDGRPTSSVHLKSREFTLDGGRRYPIVVEYSHQSVLKYRDENIAKLTLSWSTSKSPQTIIPPEYFFRSRESGGTLIISGLEARLYDLAMLEDGAQAFLHAKNLVVSDVPDIYRGARMIRTSVKPREEEIKFFISHDAIVYLAQSAHSSFIPKSDDGTTLFEKCSDVISVYAFGDNCEEAHDQHEFVIYYRRFNAGNVKIQLPRETSFFIFLQPTLANVVCQDDVQFLPFKNGDNCAASSSLSAEFDCSKGFGGGYWQSGNGRLRGQWLIRTFAHPVELRYFHFSPLSTSVPMKASVLFSDGLTEEFDLQSKLRYEFKYHGVIDSIRIALEAAGSPASGDGTETIGGTFAIFGLECGVHTVVDNEVRFPVHINFCQGGESCGSHYVDLGHPKCAHGRLTYGWSTSNVVSSILDVPFCSNASISAKGTSFLSKVHGIDNISSAAAGTKRATTARPALPIELIKSETHDAAPRMAANSSGGHEVQAPKPHNISPGLDALGKTLFLSTSAGQEDDGTIIANGSPLSVSRDGFKTLVENKEGLPLGGGKTWVIDVPVHALYRVEIHLSALCADVSFASLLLNGVEVLEGERLQKGMSVRFYGNISLERVGSLEVASKSQGLFMVSLTMHPTNT